MIGSRNSVRSTLVAVSVAIVAASASAAQTHSERIAELVNSYAEYNLFSGAVLVAERGEIIHEAGYGLANPSEKIPNAASTEFEIASLTKSFTAVVVLQLVAEGRMALDTPVTDYLPDYRADTGAKITIRHLLTHTSGLPDPLNLSFGVKDGVYTPLGYVEEWGSSDLDSEPGETFRYNNTGYFLLGAIVEAVTGSSFGEVLEARVFEPLGMSNTTFLDHGAVTEARGLQPWELGYRTVDPFNPTLSYSAGAIASTVQDMFRWDQALYGDELLPPAFRDQLFAKQQATRRPGESYGFGWLITDTPEYGRRVFHTGRSSGFNSVMSRLVDDRHTIILLSNQMPAMLSRVLTGVTAILHDDPYQLPKEPLERGIFRSLEEGGLETALTFTRCVVAEDDPVYAHSIQALAQVAIHLGFRADKADDAIAIADLAVELYPKHFMSHTLAGDLALQAGDSEAARSHFETGLELNPGFGPLVQRLRQIGSGSGG